MRKPLVHRNEGRFWMVKLGTGERVDEDGWACMLKVNSGKLQKATIAGETSTSFKIAGIMYKFDLQKMTRTNEQTGAVFEIKPPEHKWTKEDEDEEELKRKISE